MEKPRYYIQDLSNYTDEFLIEIILWQNKELRRIDECQESTNHEVNSQHPRFKPDRGGELKPLVAGDKMDNGSPADTIQDKGDKNDN